MIRIHKIAPRFRIRSRLVRIPHRLPITLELGPVAMSIGFLEPMDIGDSWVFETLSPRRLTSALMPANHNSVQHHRSITHHHIPDDVPAVRFHQQSVVVKMIDTDPAVQSTGVVLP